MKKFTFKELSKSQEELDNYIFNNNNTNHKETLQKRKVAFLVELGEFINEVRSFKFWSKKPPSSNEVILEEFVDGIHFIISIGNTMKHEEWDFSFDIEEKDFNIQIMNTYKSFIKFSESDNKKDFNNAVMDFLKLGVLLGFTQKEINKSYELKRQENKKRQDNNY